MPVVLRQGPYVVRFYSNEGDEPPHVHVAHDRAEAKFWLEDPVRLARNWGIAGHRLTEVQSLLEANRKRLLEDWNAYFGS